MGVGAVATALRTVTVVPLRRPTRLLSRSQACHAARCGGRTAASRSLSTTAISVAWFLGFMQLSTTRVSSHLTQPGASPLPCSSESPSGSSAARVARLLRCPLLSRS
jgi:hypothetical protein